MRYHVCDIHAHEFFGVMKLSLSNSKYIILSSSSVKVLLYLKRAIKMDWLGLGKHCFTFGSTSFDIGSDIANSLNFLGVFNNDSYTTITSLPLTNLTYPTTIDSTMPLSATNEMLRCTRMDQREDVVGVYCPWVLFSSWCIYGDFCVDRTCL